MLSTSRIETALIEAKRVTVPSAKSQMPHSIPPSRPIAAIGELHGGKGFGRLKK